MADDPTGRFEIHPAIGIARLGMSDSFFFGPEPQSNEQPGWSRQKFCKARPVEPVSPANLDDDCLLTSYRDKERQLKRQAVRFRLYKVKRDKLGRIVDATPADKLDVVVKWRVRLANTKAAAKKFRIPHERRNEPVKRENLKLDSDWVEPPVWSAGIRPRPLVGSIKAFASPDIQDQTDQVRSVRDVSVQLGEAYVDKTNRLVVVGPKADSGWFWDSKDSCYPEWYGFEGYNNDGWYDNAGDGPVEAEVTETGRSPVKVSAWVVVAPFNFAPDIDPFVTLYDVVYEKACERGFAGFPRVDERKEAALRTSFEDDVLPLLEKSRQIRWVNGWSMQAETQDRHFWWNRSPTDDRYEGISKPSGHFSRKAALEGEAWRKALFAHLRNPWVTVTLPLDAQQTTALRLFTEALGGFSDDIDNDRRPRCDHQIVRDFNTLENRKPGHGFDVVLSASRNALEGFVDCINVCLEAGKTIDLPVLCAAFEAVRRKREELKKEFQGYRPVIMPRQIGNDYGVFSECDGETRFSPDPLGLIEATDRMLALTKVQYSHMKNWSKGDFVERWDPCEDRPHSMTAEHYCEALTRIALEPCNGGALYPGIEVSREVLRKEIYQSAFRIDPALEPGSLTEGLAVPWQNDFFECNMEHAMSWWPASRPDNVFLRIPVDEVDVQGEEMSSWTGQVLNAETGRWREFLVNRTHRFMDDWSKLAVVVKKEVPPGIALVRVRPVREGPGYKSFDKITETDLLYAAVDEYEQWTRWWKASGCPPVEIEYYDLKASKRYLMDLRGITPPRSESSKEPVLGYVIDTVALEEWERTRRPDIEYYEKDGKFYKRYYVYVADVQDTSPREVHDERKLTPRMFPDDDQYPE